MQLGMQLGMQRCMQLGMQYCMQLGMQLSHRTLSHSQLSPHSQLGPCAPAMRRRALCLLAARPLAAVSASTALSSVPPALSIHSLPLASLPPLIHR